jgi:shikimate kinase
MHLLLIGLFCCGKTTVGKLLAEDLGLPFYDTDFLIEKELGESCRAYYQREGELAFRKLEYVIIKKVMLEPKGVLAVGGGAPIYTPSREILMSCNPRFYLEYSLAYIKENFLERGIPPFVHSLEEIYQHRHPLYQVTASECIKVSRDSAEEIKNKIKNSFF